LETLYFENTVLFIKSPADSVVMLITFTRGTAMRNILVLATLSSFMISCATMKSWMGSSETPATQEQPKPTDPLDLSDADAAKENASSGQAAAEPAQEGAELSNHSDPYVAEAASDIAAQTQAPADNSSGDSHNLPQKTVNEEMERAAPSWKGDPTPAIANVAPEEPQVYNSSSFDSPRKGGKLPAKKMAAAKGKKEVAKKPKVDCKKVAKAGKKAKKNDVAFCKAEKKALAKAAAKKPKVDCKKVAKLGKKAKKPDVAFCKAEKKKKASKSRVASKN
jgi:hypothetical protein